MLQSKQIIEKNTTIYVITHGRPNPKDRPTTWWLEEAGLPFKFVMNEKQVDSYLSAGVSESQIVSVSDEWEDEYFERHKTYPVPFHGAIWLSSNVFRGRQKELEKICLPIRR